MAFIQFPVVGDYQGFAFGSVINGSVSFTTNLPNGAVVKSDEDIGLVPVVFKAMIHNGILMDEVGETVSLYANDPDFNLSGDLQYTVEFDAVKASGQGVSITGFTFTAPTDSTEVDLVTLAPAATLTIASVVNVNPQTGTTYTLSASDAQRLVTLSNASAVTVTVPTNLTTPFPVGARIDLAQLGAGQVTVAAAGGVTINATPGLKLSARYAGATLTKLATNTWLLVGSLTS